MSVITAEESRVLLVRWWAAKNSALATHLRAALRREAAERYRAEKAEAERDAAEFECVVLHDDLCAALDRMRAERDAALAEAERLREVAMEATASLGAILEVHTKGDEIDAATVQKWFDQYSAALANEEKDNA